MLEDKLAFSPCSHLPTRVYSEKHSKKEKALERLREGDAWDSVALEFAEHAGSKGR